MKATIDPTLLRNRRIKKEPERDRNCGVGKLMRAMRTGAGLTQARAAEIMGLERTSVTNMESGKQAIHLDRLEMLADACGVEVVISLQPKPANVQVEEQR